MLISLVRYTRPTELIAVLIPVLWGWAVVGGQKAFGFLWPLDLVGVAVVVAASLSAAFSSSTGNTSPAIGSSTATRTRASVG